MTCTAVESTLHEAAGTWQRLLSAQPAATVFLSPLWQATWWEVFCRTAGELHVLTLGAERGEPGIAPLVRQGTTLSFLGDTDLFDYHDFIMGAGDPRGFFEELTQCLDHEAWQTLDLRSLPGASPTLQYLPDLLRGRGHHVHIEKEDVVPGMALPATFEAYVQGLGKHDRHELRRKLRRLQGAGSFRLTQAQQGTLADDVSDLLDMMRESHEEKRSFMAPDRERFFRLAAQRTAEVGVLRLFFLELDGHRVAGVLCFDYAGRRLLYNSGYRLAFASLGVGLMCKVLAIQDAINVGMTYFDFLRGPEPYKHNLGAQDHDLMRIVAHRGPRAA